MSPAITLPLPQRHNLDKDTAIAYDGYTVMKKLLAVSLSFSLLLTTTFPAFAQNSAFPGGSDTSSGNASSQQMHEQIQQAKLLSQQERQETRQQTKESMQQARAQFKTQLAQIKDQRKQQLTQQIDERIQTVNQLRTAQMSKALSKLSTILDSVASKEASIQQQGVDTASVSALITAARSAIAASQQAVASQAANDYVIQIASESALKANVGTTVRSFTSDMRETFTTVKAARKAVVEAARALARMRHEAGNSSTPASESANQ